jgi:hypothetical protein
MYIKVREIKPEIDPHANHDQKVKKRIHKTGIFANKKRSNYQGTSRSVLNEFLIQVSLLTLS